MNDGGRFINVAPVVERGGHPGLPFPGGAVLMWGSGRYRDSDVYLAAVPLDGVEERDAWWYWRGDVPGASPWSGDEADAAPLFAHPEVGELSVAWIGPIQRWMMTYNARHPDGIVYRTAPKPWGPWTAPQLLYDPYGPLGFGTMIHGAWADGDLDGTDLLYDRGRGEEGGAAYGGYIVDRYTRRIDGETAEVFFALSTWNPYQVTLMAAQLRLVQTVTAEVFVKIGEDPGTVTASTGQGVHHARVGTRLGAAVDSGPHLAAGTQASASVEKITAHLVTGRDRTRVGVEDEQRTVDPLLGERPRGALALVQSTFGAKQRNFELVVPRVGGGLLLRAADNDGDVPAWRSVVTAFGGGDPPPVVGFEAVAMALSPVPDLGNGDDPGQRRRDRLIVVGVTGDRLAYLWRDREAPWPWRGPFPVIAVEPDDRRIPLTGVRGNPTLIPSTFGDRRQNFQLVVPDARAGIRHIWMDHDQPFPLNPDWRLAPTFAATLGRVDAVTMIQSTFLDGDRGHLEAVIRRGGELHFCWRGRAGWSDPFPIVTDGGPIDGAIGVPALVQGGQGTRRRNFELVTPLAAGGLGAYSLDNDPDEAGLRRWHGPVVTDPGTRYDAVAMIQGPFGAAPGNLEVAASTADGRVVHLWRNALTQAWSNPAPLIPA